MVRQRDRRDQRDPDQAGRNQPDQYTQPEAMSSAKACRLFWRSARRLGVGGHLGTSQRMRACRSADARNSI